MCLFKGFFCNVVNTHHMFDVTTLALEYAITRLQDIRTWVVFAPMGALLYSLLDGWYSDIYVIQCYLQRDDRCYGNHSPQLVLNSNWKLFCEAMELKKTFPIGSRVDENFDMCRTAIIGRSN